VKFENRLGFEKKILIGGLITTIIPSTLGLGLVPT